jgi:hypothetical protein
MLELKTGEETVSLDLRGFPGGQYTLRITENKNSLSKKITILDHPR